MEIISRNFTVKLEKDKNIATLKTNVIISPKI